MSSSDAGGNLGRISLTIGITLANVIIECRASRSTTKLYDPAVTLGDDQIRELVKIATTTPISFNLRNLRFIAVRTPEAKARLRAVAWDQPKVTDAAVTFIICRQFVDHSVLPARLASALEAGIMPAQMVPRCENAARGAHFEQTQRQCEEPVRNGANGAAAMIYAAHALGMGSPQIIGLDADAVAYEFAMVEDEETVRQEERRA